MQELVQATHGGRADCPLQSVVKRSWTVLLTKRRSKGQRWPRDTLESRTDEHHADAHEEPPTLYGA